MKIQEVETNWFCSNLASQPSSSTQPEMQRLELPAFEHCCRGQCWIKWLWLLLNFGDKGEILDNL